MTDGPIEAFPKGEGREAAATTGAAALNMVPLGGGTAGTLFEKTLRSVATEASRLV